MGFLEGVRESLVKHGPWAPLRLLHGSQQDRKVIHDKRGKKRKEKILGFSWPTVRMENFGF